MHHPFFARKHYYEVPKNVLRKVTANDKCIILNKVYSRTLLFDITSHGRNMK